MKVANLVIYRGDTHVFDVQVVDTLGNAFDVSLAQVACTVRSRHGEEIRPDVSVSGNVVRLTFNAEHTKNVQFSHADFVESTRYWKAMAGYRSILEKAKAIDGTGYVAIDDATATNAINGTGSTSSRRESHYGNDAYSTVIAPKVVEKMGG